MMCGGNPLESGQKQVWRCGFDIATYCDPIPLGFPISSSARPDLPGSPGVRAKAKMTLETVAVSAVNRPLCMSGVAGSP